MWNGMLYDVECLWPGWTTECERCDEEEPKMWNGGVKLWCGVEGVEYHGVILNVLWYG